MLDDEPSKTDNDVDADAMKKNKGYMRIFALTPNRHILINMKLYACHFMKFYCKKKKLNIGVDMNSLHDFLKAIGNDYTMTMYMDEDNMNVLMIRAISNKKNSKIDVQINLIEARKQDVDAIRPMEFETMITMDASEFYKMCKNYSTTADYMDIISVGNEMTFKGRGESGFISITMSHSDADNGDKLEKSEKKKKNDNIIQGTYELKNLIMFGKCYTICRNIDIYMKSNFPLVIKLTVTSLGVIYFLCTPSKPPSNS